MTFSTLEILGYTLLLIWVIIVFYNIDFFSSRKSRKIDEIFVPKKNFEEAIKDLELLKEFKGKEYNSAHKKILFYQSNARLTKRKYSYYRDKIDRGLIKLYFGPKKSYWENFTQLDQPIKLFLIFLYLLFALGIISIILWLTIYGKSAGVVITFSIVLLATLIRFYNFLFRIGYLTLFCAVEVVLYLTKRDRGRFHRNYAILDLMTSSWWGSGMIAYAGSSGGTVISAGGISSFGGGSGGFGGFGGGSFGGGGAGGSW